MAISFIIIGKNEGWKLTKCLYSVFNTIEKNKLQEFEIIYVDSNSSDDSIYRAKEFGGILIYKLIGDSNPAIARNLGAAKSKSDVLFFIDGDMEIIPEFLPKVYSEPCGLLYKYVSGNFINYYYNQNWEFVRKDYYKKNKKDIFEFEVGGLFLIEKELWLKVGGMRNIFKKSQDIDLSLRLAKKGVKLLRKYELAAIHHTIPYLEKNRKWEDLFNGVHLYARSLLYRYNLGNIYMIKRLFRNDYTIVILISAIVSAIFFNKLYLVSVYFIILIIKSKISIMDYLYFFLRDTTALIGFFTFYPNKTKNISYTEVKICK